MKYWLYVKKVGEISETQRCFVDICCLQEVRWKSKGARMIVNGFNFFAVGVLKQKMKWEWELLTKLVDKAVCVERYSDQVMKNNIIIRGAIQKLVFCYLPKIERPATKKEKFSEGMIKVITSENLVGGDFNDHVICDVGRFREAYVRSQEWTGESERGCV